MGAVRRVRPVEKCVKTGCLSDLASLIQNDFPAVVFGGGFCGSNSNSSHGNSTNDSSQLFAKIFVSHCLFSRCDF